MAQNVKKLWFRLGVSIPLNEEELCLVQKGGTEGVSVQDIRAAEDLLIAKIRANCFDMDGETYAPSLVDQGDDFWPLDQEINFLLDCPSAQLNSATPNEIERKGIIKHEHISESSV